MNGTTHKLLIWLVVISGVLLAFIVYNLVRFSSIGPRYTACDGAQHELIYHGVELPEECQE